MSTENMLETFELTVGYDKKKVVEDISLEVKKGQLVCLLGPNGSGKSTILKTLSSLLPPVKGAVRICGKDLNSINKKALSKILAVVLTERLSVGFLSAFEVAAMGRHPHTGFLGGLNKADRGVVWDCLRMVNAEGIALRNFNELSDGERQKILLARALAQEPELIVLDEPTTHLDVRHKLEVLSILKRLSREKGITVILSLHEVDLALKSCDMAVMVKNGKIAGMGLPEEVGSDKAVSELFDIESAGFSAFLGTMELVNTLAPSVFVAGGGGTAAGIYRQLTRNNIGFCTGILHENDVDCHIAETMGVPTVKEKAFESIGGAAVSMAGDMIKNTSVVIDTGFPVSGINLANHKLILDAAAEGRRVFSVRNDTDRIRLYGGMADRIKQINAIEDMLGEHGVLKEPAGRLI